MHVRQYNNNVLCGIVIFVNERCWEEQHIIPKCTICYIYTHTVYICDDLLKFSPTIFKV